MGYVCIVHVIQKLLSFCVFTSKCPIMHNNSFVTKLVFSSVHPQNMLNKCIGAAVKLCLNFPCEQLDAHVCSQVLCMWRHSAQTPATSIYLSFSQSDEQDAISDSSGRLKKTNSSSETEITVLSTC